MYILGLDTTTRKTRLVLLKNDEVVFEREWTSNANESETVIKTLHGLTETTPMLFQQLKKIISIHGPGGFNATRVGVTIANSLLWLTNAEIVPHETFVWWKKRLAKEQQKLKPHLLIKINEHEIFVDEKPTDFAGFAKEMKKRKTPYYCYGEISPTQQHELKHAASFQWIGEDQLKKFSEVLKDIGGKATRKHISPKYLKPPKITKAKKKTRYVK